jgi:septum formation protein
VLTADTVVVFGGRCLGKPVDMHQAWEFLRMFSGKKQDVLTAVAFSVPAGACQCAVVESSVCFMELSDAVIGEYFARVDPLDKAGAYDIDECGEMIIESFRGSRTNIMGLPAETVAAFLANADPRFAAGDPDE